MYRNLILTSVAIGSLLLGAYGITFVTSAETLPKLEHTTSHSFFTEDSINNSGRVSENLPWIPFEWVGDSIGDRYYDKLGIYLPFSIEGIPHQFKSQFDLGAVNTMVYGNTIAPYLAAYPAIAAKVDTLDRTYLVQGQQVGGIENVTIQLGDVTFADRDLLLFENYGGRLPGDSIASSSVKIGTVAPDLFQDKLLLIDYPNQRIASVDSLPTSLRGEIFYTRFKLEQGRIKIPLTINGETHDFLFDTGASMFHLHVTPEDWGSIGDTTARVDTVEISTWGEYYDVYGLPIKAEVALGDFPLEGGQVFANPREDFAQFFKEEGILGITGNVYFSDYTIIIDYKNQQFGILTE